MMTAEQIRALLHRQPFRPFRFHLTDGRTFDIRHPEMILVLRGAVDIGLTDGTESTIPDRVERVSLIHVVSVEELQPA